MNTHSANFRKLGITTFALFAFLLGSRASAQVWRSAGLTGGDVRSLASDPHDARIVYLGTTDGHIFGSRDAGQSWKLLGLAGANLNAVVTGLVVDPRNSSLLFASTWTREASSEGGGIFVSHNGGVTWHESSLGVHAVRALVQAPSNPEMLAAGALDGVFVSQDGARNWQRVTPADDPELRNFDSLVIDPVNPEIMYAGTFHLPWKTIDGGAHWFPIHGGMIDDSDVLSLAIDVTNPQRIFSSACSGIYRSDASGALWEKIEGIPYSSRRTLVIRQDPAQPNILYAGTTEGLWKSSDAGATWARISPASWVINAMLLQPPDDLSGVGSGLSRPSHLLIGTEEQGVIASDDGGLHFRAANDGFHHRRILSVAVDARDISHVATVLANAPESVLVSQDGGMSWNAMDQGLGRTRAQAIFSSPTGWWAALASGGLAHYDGSKKIWSENGIVWRSLQLSSPAQNAGRTETISPPAVNDLYVTTDAAWFAATEHGLFKTQDQGKTWTRLRFTSADLPVQSVRASSDGQVIRIVASHGMVFSNDAGVSWTWHDLPLESGGVLKLDSADESTLLAVAPHGVYVSRDAGLTWAREQSGLPSARAEQLLLRPGFWLASMAPEPGFPVESAGLYASKDAGASWSRIPIGSLPGLIAGAAEFPVLAAALDEQSIFVGSANDGLFIIDSINVDLVSRLTAGASDPHATHLPGGH